MVFSTLPALYESLILGAPLPSTLVIRHLTTPTLLAGTLFLHRETLLSPLTLPLVYGLDLAEREGFPATAHLPSLPELRLPYASQPKPEITARIGATVATLRDYLACPPPELPKGASVLDVGSNGFVVAEGLRTPLPLYQQGYLRGVIFPVAPFTTVTIFKKSRLVPMDLGCAQRYLKALDSSLGVAFDPLSLLVQTRLTREEVVKVLTYC